MNSLSSGLKFHLLHLFPILAGVLSCAGCLFNILLTVLLKGLFRSAIGKMVIFLTLMDLCIHLTSLLFLLGLIRGSFCGLISLFATYGAMGISCCFGGAVLKVAKYGGDSVLENYYAKYICLSTYMIFLPLPKLIILGMTAPVMGGEIRDYIFFGLLSATPAISFIICCYKYCQAIEILMSQQGKIFYEFLFYPMIFILSGISWIFLILGLTRSSFYDLPDYLIVICAHLWQLQGFFNSIVFGLYRQVHRICCRKNQEPELVSLEVSSILEENDPSVNANLDS